MASNLDRRIGKLEQTPARGGGQGRVNQLLRNLHKIYGDGEPYENDPVTPEEFDKVIVNTLKMIYGDDETSSDG